MIRQYSLAKDGAKLLAPDFRVREFRCKDGSDQILVDAGAGAAAPVQLREHFGKAVTITSGYRTPAHNAKVGGSKSSASTCYGRAADIQVAEHQRGGRGSIRGKPAAQLGRRWPLSRQGRPGKGLGAR